MNRNPIPRTALLALLGGSLIALTSLAAAEPAGGVLIVVDGNGKEHKLKTWKIVSGTRPLGWLAPAVREEPGKEVDGEEPKPEAKIPAGPEALVFREENSTNFVEGIVTLVPIEQIRSIEYDNEKQTVAVRFATGNKDEDSGTITGSTRFKGINKLIIEAEAELGDLGIAEVKFQGGIPKGGIRSVTFPGPRPSQAAAGRKATITANEKDPTLAQHQVVDIRPLYRMADGSMRTMPFLMFRKTVKLDLDKVQKLRFGEATGGDSPECQVTLKDGAEHTLTLLRSIELEDGQKAVLEGLLGRVPAGYKLFPVHTIVEMEFEGGL